MLRRAASFCLSVAMARTSRKPDRFFRTVAWLRPPGPLLPARRSTRPFDTPDFDADAGRPPRANLRHRHLARGTARRSRGLPGWGAGAARLRDPERLGVMGRWFHSFASLRPGVIRPGR